jgi:two-component system, sensor histidine kinase RegB
MAKLPALVQLMTDLIAVPSTGPRSLRLDTLVGLRWLAVVGQAAAVVVVNLILGFPLPLASCLGLIALSALVNVTLRVRYTASHRLDATPALLLLGYDVLQLSALLFLTGGLDNPFTVLLLVPLIVSATTLPPRPTIILGVLVVAAASVLALVHLPLPWLPGAAIPFPFVYSAGVWLALVSASVFTGVYTFRVADEARQLAKALTATELVLAREQHLSALDGLAAAAAHELGTPLATIALVAKELERELAPDTPQGEDIVLLKTQVKRCRDILAKLTSLPGERDEHFARQPLSHLIEEVVEPYRAFATEIEIVPPKGTGPEPIGTRNPAIVHGLANLVENAMDFAKSKVEIATEWDADRVVVTIRDDGPGFAPGIIARIGEPYLTTRGRTGAAPSDSDSGGLGLGVFIAKTLLERTGARLELANREAPASGAIVAIAWPRHKMDGEAAPETIAEGTAWREPAESL